MGATIIYSAIVLMPLVLYFTGRLGLRLGRRWESPALIPFNEASDFESFDTWRTGNHAANTSVVATSELEPQELDVHLDRFEAALAWMRTTGANYRQEFHWGRAKVVANARRVWLVSLGLMLGIYCLFSVLALVAIAVIAPIEREPHLLANYRQQFEVVFVGPLIYLLVRWGFAAQPAARVMRESHLKIAQTDDGWAGELNAAEEPQSWPITNVWVDTPITRLSQAVSQVTCDYPKCNAGKVLSPPVYRDREEIRVPITKRVLVNHIDRNAEPPSNSYTTYEEQTVGWETHTIDHYDYPGPKDCPRCVGTGKIDTANWLTRNSALLEDLRERVAVLNHEVDENRRDCHDAGALSAYGARMRELYLSHWGL